MARSRIVVVAVIVFVIGAVFMVAAVRSIPSGCTYAAPAPSLAPALRAQGGFDSSIDGNDHQAVEAQAALAGSTSSNDLIGATGSEPVSIAATDSSTPPAVVVPLTSSEVSAAHPVIGLVVFLANCDGSLVFSRVVDLTASPVAEFPTVSQAAATTALGGSVALQYTSDPTHPVWKRTNSAATTPAT